MASKKNIKKHAVTFNMNDPEQAAMYNYLAQFPNVSGKLKRLVWSDMNGIVSQKREEPIQESIVDEKIKVESIDSLL